MCDPDETGTVMSNAEFAGAPSGAAAENVVVVTVAAGALSM